MNKEVISSPDNKQVKFDNARYLLDIFVPSDSRGLMVDAAILQKAFGKEKVRILAIPFKSRPDIFINMGNNLDFKPNAEIAVFLECLFNDSKLIQYKKRVFLPNPEWMTAKDREIAKSTITDFWHKTRHSLNLLSKIFPEINHKYIGFTSLNNKTTVKDYDKFLHFPGKSKTRHTQEIINIWLKESNLPELKIQAYGRDIEIPKWISVNNIRLFLGFLKEQDLQSEFSECGIHICTSQMEGFGHYINEARSIGALIITLDAPPMNELIDSTCGIVIPTKQFLPHHHGVRFIATPEAIKGGILRALEMSIQERKILGEKARNRFLIEENEFYSRLNSVVFPENSSSASSNFLKESTKNEIPSKREAIFSEIYEKGTWGKSKDPSKPFYSGSGSHAVAIASSYIESIHTFLKKYPEKPNIVDFGCGDFFIGSQIRPLCNEYIACDIVPKLIEFNKKEYEKFDVDFRILDLVCDDLPNAEIVFIRQVLQHLSNFEINQIIPKLIKKFKYLILTEHLPCMPNFTHNIDKPTGPNIRLELGSGIVLTSPPFNLTPKAERILCEVDEYGGIIRTTLYELQ